MDRSHRNQSAGRGLIGGRGGKGPRRAQYKYQWRPRSRGGKVSRCRPRKAISCPLYLTDQTHARGPKQRISSPATLSLLANMKTSSFLLLPLAMGVSALALPQPVAPRLIEPRLSINTVLAWISELFPSEILLTASSDIIGAAEQALAIALGYDTTHNDLVDGQCGDVTLIFARGTDDPGNVGALVGPEFYAALQSALGSTSSIFQGVNNYDATVTEYLEGGSTTGASNMSVFGIQDFLQATQG